MKPAIIASFFLALHSASFADEVDSVSEKYERLLNEGRKTLYQREVDDLKKVLDEALRNKNLDLANKAKDRIQVLSDEVVKLDPSDQPIGPVGNKYPASNDYRMTWTNGRTGSEKGAEIVCRFARVSRIASKEGTLTLTIKSGRGRYSNTPNDIFILSKKGGKEIAVIKGIGTGKTKVVPLALSAADNHEISVVVRGSEALHLHPHEKGIPEMYLTIE